METQDNSKDKNEANSSTVPIPEQIKTENPTFLNYYPGIFFKKCILPRRFHKMLFALILLCLVSLGQGMIVTGQLVITIPMLEKNFGYTSVQTGLIHSMYDICFGISAILSGLFGKKRKMLIIGIGAFIMAFGCYSFTSPNFLHNFSVENQTMMSEIMGNEYATCQANHTNTNQCKTKGKIIYLIIFCASYGLIGNNLKINK